MTDGGGKAESIFDMHATILSLPRDRCTLFKDQLTPLHCASPRSAVKFLEYSFLFSRFFFPFFTVAGDREIRGDKTKGENKKGRREKKTRGGM